MHHIRLDKRLTTSYLEPCLRTFEKWIQPSCVRKGRESFQSQGATSTVGAKERNSSWSRLRTEYCCDRGRRFQPRVLTACSGRFLTAGSPNHCPILTQASDGKSAAG